MAVAQLCLVHNMQCLYRYMTLIILVISLSPAHAQDKGTLTPQNLPPITITPTTAAKQIFGRQTTPSKEDPRVIGFYSRGCLAGAQALPITGEAWQVMRLSRHRNWGHPALIAFLQRMARADRDQDIWSGFLIGDMAQPRGGPMITGHASHQIGLDADVWLTPMPDHVLSREERETMSALDLVRADGMDINPRTWRPEHINLIRSIAEQKDVQRIFVNPAIKKALCREVRGDRDWMAKVRPMYGHNYHIHIRLLCPKDEASCQAQDPPPRGDGCDESLDWWFTQEGMHPKPQKPQPPLTLAALPKACTALIHSP